MGKKLKRGEGSVRQRKDGRWEGRYVIGYDPKGLPKTKNVLAKTKSECLEKLRKLREDITAPAPAVQPAKPDMTFGEWLDRWYQDHCRPGIQPKTQEEYENRIYRHILPELGGIPLKKLTRNDLQQFYTRLKQHGRLSRTNLYGKGLSDRTVRGCHTACNMALEQAVRDGLIPKNPAAHCRLPSAHPAEMKVLTAEEMQRLLIQAREDGCYELLLLELSTGLRRGELCALRWDDLDFNTGELRIQRQVQRTRGELTVSHPKTKSSQRSIILPPPVLRVLSEYRKTVSSRWMFPSPKKADSPRDPTAVRKKFSAVLERAGCKHVRLHDCRHGFATNALAHGMDVKTLSTILGHVSSSTTLNVYAHVTDEMRQSAAAKIDQGIAGVQARPDTAAKPPKPSLPDFQARKGKNRKPGTGHIRQIGEHLWEGRYSPKVNGVPRAKNIYAHSEAECEEKLAELIAQMKAEIAAERNAS